MPDGSGRHRFWWPYGGELGQTFEVLNRCRQQELADDILENLAQDIAVAETAEPVHRER